MQVKIFDQPRHDDLQEEINKWLKENPKIKIQFVCQSESQGQLIANQGPNILFHVTIWYE